MRQVSSIALFAGIVTFSGGAVSLGQDSIPYQSPPQEVLDILEAPPTPGVSIDPHDKMLLLIHTTQRPDIKALSQPMYRLGGSRFNPLTNGPSTRGGAVTGLTLIDIASRQERKVDVPDTGRLGRPSWSPDGRYFSFTNTLENGIELWVASVTNPTAWRVAPALVNAAARGGGCSWMPDSTAVLCKMISESRGEPPAASPVPIGPIVQQTAGGKAAVRTYQDLLKNAHDADTWEYYMTSSLVLIDVKSGRPTPLTGEGIWDFARPSPDGRYFLVQKTVRPFSFLVTAGSFPKEVDILDRSGRSVYEVARVPLSDKVPIGGVRTGRRSYSWRPLEDATLTWAEALDDGDPRQEAEYRDVIRSLAAPFTGQPSEVAKTRERYAGLSYGENGLVLLNEMNRRKRWITTWRLDGAEPKKIFDRSLQDAYGNPGTPLFKVTERGTGVIRQMGDVIFLRGQGSSPDGDHPFVDRYDLVSGEKSNIFRSSPDAYETVVAMLDDGGRQLILRRESPDDPPNYFLRNGDREVALTDFPDPAPQLRGITKQRLTYQRADGVELSATLYLPPGYQQGQRLPVVFWAYPREYNSASTASQVRGSLKRFTRMGGTSHMFFLTQGYAILDNPTMPIVGDEGNDTFVDQLVASAKAAVDKVVEMGVADRHRIGVGGHSYGAFMTANLLAHSDLFAAGVARSGAYNRTLTPFGFQNERRTFWEAPQVYFAMSPFMHADQVNEPILLIHGTMDNNSGTFPIQSERFYHALKGHGATVRYVQLPYESHGYAARESVRHTLWEMITWFDKYVKNAPPPATDGGK